MDDIKRERCKENKDTGMGQKLLETILTMVLPIGSEPGMMMFNLNYL